MTRILKSFEFSRTFGLEKITTTKNPALVSGSSPISGVQVFEWRQRASGRQGVSPGESSQSCL